MANRTNFTASPLGALLSLGSTYFYFLAFNQALALDYLFIALLVMLHSSGLYLLASRFQKTPLGESMRGAIIGLNAGLNGILFHLFTENIILSIVIGTLVFLSAFLFISRHPVYHTLLGYFNWFLPMSWAVNLPGMLIYLVNLIVAPFGYLHPLLGALRIRLFFDLNSCSFTMYGGLIRPFKGFSGLNMGNFIFINPGWEHLLKHEIGHLFSLAALGAPFHYIGGIDENYLQSNYWEAFAEYLAESYSTPSASVLSMWK